MTVPRLHGTWKYPPNLQHFITSAQRKWTFEKKQECGAEKKKKFIFSHGYLAVSYLPAQLERWVKILQSNGTQFGNVHMVYEPFTWLICLLLSCATILAFLGMHLVWIMGHADIVLFLTTLVCTFVMSAYGDYLVFKLVLWEGQQKLMCDWAFILLDDITAKKWSMKISQSEINIARIAIGLDALNLKQ